MEADHRKQLGGHNRQMEPFENANVPAKPDTKRHDNTSKWRLTVIKEIISLCMTSIPPRIKATALALLSCLFISCLAVIAKMNSAIPVFFMCFTRTLVRAIIVVVYALLAKTNIKNTVKDRKTCLFLVLRSSIGNTSFVFSFVAFRILPIGDAIAIMITTPVFVSLLGWIFLGEKLSACDFVCIILAVTGSICIAHPHFLFGRTGNAASHYGIGIGFAIATSVLRSTTQIVVRHLKYVDFIVIIGSLSLCGVVMNAVLTTFTGQWHVSVGISEVSQLILQGIVGFLSQVCFTNALHYEKAVFVSMILTGQILMAFAWNVFLFHLIPSGWSIAGAAVILTSVLAGSLRKLVMDMKDKQLPKEDETVPLTGSTEKE